MSNDWKKSEVWRWRENGFCVEVVHSRVESDPETDKGPNRWCVYAYIYPNHAHFNNFGGADMFQAAAIELPLHGGPSMLRWHTIDLAERPSSVQVGADYNHIHDKLFTFMYEKDEAHEVFRDANTLVLWLKNYKESEEPK